MFALTNCQHAVCVAYNHRTWLKKKTDSEETHRVRAELKHEVGGRCKKPDTLGGSSHSGVSPKTSASLLIQPPPLLRTQEKRDSITLNQVWSAYGRGCCCSSCLTLDNPGPCFADVHERACVLLDFGPNETALSMYFVFVGANTLTSLYDTSFVPREL